MKTSWFKRIPVPCYAVVATALICGVAPVIGGLHHDSKETTSDSNAEDVSPQGVAVTPTPTPTPTVTPSGTPPPQIDGVGTIAGPNGREAQFFIFDVENEQVTPRFLEGEFGYSDRKSHITFTTGKIETVTINGNQGAFTGTARIGGKHRQTVQFTVTVTANQSPATGDTFSIALSNGYAASGNLTSGKISIQTLDPD